MGIAGLIPKLRKAMTSRRLDSFSASTKVLIDVSLFIHTAVHGLADLLLASSGSNFDRFVLSQMTKDDLKSQTNEREEKFISECGKSVIDKILEIVQQVKGDVMIVFDGTSPPMKVETVRRRKRIMAEAKSKVDTQVSFEDLKSDATTTTTTTTATTTTTTAATTPTATTGKFNFPDPFNTKLLTNSVHANSDKMSSDFKNTRKAGASSEHHSKILAYILDHLKSNQMAFTVAPYEADAQLTFLSKTFQQLNVPSLVITEDSDTIPYGVRTTLFKLNCKQGTAFHGEVLKYRDVTAQDHEKLDWSQFTESMVACACIGSGCDYLGNLPGCGIVTSTQHVRKAFFESDLTETSALEVLLDLFISNHGRHLTGKEQREYKRNFIEALALFRHPVVYDLAAGKSTIFNPPPNNCDKELASYEPYRNLVGDADALEDVCGVVWSEELCRAISQGYVDPHTKDVYECSTEGVEKTPEWVYKAVNHYNEVEAGAAEARKAERQKKRGAMELDEEKKEEALSIQAAEEAVQDAENKRKLALSAAENDEEFQAIKRRKKEEKKERKRRKSEEKERRKSGDGDSATATTKGEDSENSPPDDGKGNGISPAKIAEIKEELKRLYQIYEPSKANKVNNLLKKYKGNEISLLEWVKEKYKDNEEKYNLMTGKEGPVGILAEDDKKAGEEVEI